ncbi:MAG: hypothetical protein WAK16_01490 [Candidatus Cybelea sp.]
MTMSNLARLVAGISTAVAILTACNGGPESQFAPAEPVPQTTQPAVAHSPLDALEPLRRNRKSDLIYVSAQGSGYIYVFTYPGLQLSLFALPAPKETAEGFCSDRKGNVWVVESLGVFEYAHGGNLQIAGFLESGDPFGCAVNPTNGNLAVANFDPPNQATVAITDPKTAGPSGGWKLYTDSAFQGFVYCGYDDEGNLFVSGYTASNLIGLAELPKGASTFTNLKVRQPLYGAAGVQWDGKYLAVGDGKSTVYQFSIGKGKATKKGSTSLGGAQEVYQFWIQGKHIFGADYGSSSVGIWKYPAGGSALNTIKGINKPLGITISRAK